MCGAKPVVVYGVPVRGHPFFLELTCCFWHLQTIASFYRFIELAVCVCVFQSAIEFEISYRFHCSQLRYYTFSLCFIFTFSLNLWTWWLLWNFCWDSRVFPNFEPWTTEIWLMNDLFCFVVPIFWILFNYFFYWNVFLKSNGIFPVTDSRVLQRQFTNGVSVCMYVLSDSIGTILKTRPFVKTV